MLVVTHEMGFARNVSNKVVFMENGVVVEEGPSKEFFAIRGKSGREHFCRILNSITSKVSRKAANPARSTESGQFAIKKTEEAKAASSRTKQKRSGEYYEKENGSSISGRYPDIILFTDRMRNSTADNSSASSSSSASSASASGDLLEQIQSKGEIVVAMEGTWAPWTYHDEDDNLVGYDVEVAQQIAEKLGVRSNLCRG